ncbi:MAG: hypothetical protein E7373_02445 [Clostridiales bacterium]|nr:hypothetical protein [Clostridiales bacterium]
MINLIDLIKDTTAFNTVKGDVESNKLSHAYLILTADGENLTEYLKIFASLAVCKESFPCGKCRACTLIQKDAFSDVIVYPKNGDSIVSEEVNQLIEESFVKPLESDKKIFILSHAESMTVQAQNKLLKTLEEPPQNVHIFIGATSEFPILPTVKSRVKKLEIPTFTHQKLFSVLKEEFTDTERLKEAIFCGDGTLGQAVLNYSDEKLKEVSALIEEIIVDMKSSSDVLRFSTKITASKCDMDTFLSVFELKLRDMLVKAQGEEGLVGNLTALNRVKNAENFSSGAIIFALESIGEAHRRRKFNVNATMLLEWLLLKILEGKYKWQKL